MKEKNVKKNKLKVATVFSGIGGFEHALDRMNIEHDIIFACDIDDFNNSVGSEL